MSKSGFGQVISENCRCIRRPCIGNLPWHQMYHKIVRVRLKHQRFRVQRTRWPFSSTWNRGALLLKAIEIHKIYSYDHRYNADYGRCVATGIKQSIGGALSTTKSIRRKGTTWKITKLLFTEVPNEKAALILAKAIQSSEEPLEEVLLKRSEFSVPLLNLLADSSCARSRYLVNFSLDNLNPVVYVLGIRLVEKLD